VRVAHLLRHAKSSWDDPDRADIDRPLAPRGRRAARAMADHLAREGVRPDVVLCSPARRTRETLEIVRKAFPEAEVRIDEGLYGAEAVELLERLRSLPDGAASAMAIGHNPGLHDLAVALAGDGEGDALARLAAKMPTGALATLRSSVARWRDLSPGAAELVSFVAPRELR
jgi:phosphohistidine phosphatase